MDAISICLSVGTLVFVYPPLCLPLYSYKERPANPQIRIDHFLNAVPSEIHEHPLHLMCALEKGVRLRFLGNCIQFAVYIPGFQIMLHAYEI